MCIYDEFLAWRILLDWELSQHLSVSQALETSLSLRTTHMPAHVAAYITSSQSCILTCLVYFDPNEPQAGAIYLIV